jgi:cobalt/nickel transport protein
VKKRTVVITLIFIVLIIILVPIFLLKGAEFGGSDEAGSQMINEVTNKEHIPWFKPILEKYLGGEIPGEMETLFFCIQTGIGVGILAFCFGYLVARKKYDPSNKNATNTSNQKRESK